MQEVLDIFVENMTNERLDEIIQQDSSYQEVLERLDTAYKPFERFFKESEDPKVKNIINEYDTIQHEESALYARLAYKQGMKDVMQLLLALI